MLGAMLVERSIEQKVHLHEATGEHVNFNDLFAGLWKCFCMQAASILRMHHKKWSWGVLTDFFCTYQPEQLCWLQRSLFYQSLQ